MKFPVVAKEKVRRGMIAFLCAYLALLAFLYVKQRDFLYFPGPALQAPAHYGVPEAQVIRVQPSDGAGLLTAWYFPPADPEKPVILYFHGNGGGIDIRNDRAQYYHDNGYGILLAEYRGYGGNPGSPSQDGIFADADGYYDWLVNEANIPESRIVLYGESLGTGVATYLAVKHGNARALVLESPYTSMKAMAQLRFFFVPAWWMVKDEFNTLSRIGSIQMPLMVMHGTKDKIVPYRYGQRVFAAAPEPKIFKTFDGGGHTDLYHRGAGPAVAHFLSGLPAE